MKLFCYSGTEHFMPSNTQDHDLLFIFKKEVKLYEKDTLFFEFVCCRICSEYIHRNKLRVSANKKLNKMA